MEKGKTLFHAKCGYCHLAGGTGTMMLGFRLGKDKSLLENRTDLTTTYIEHVARSGIGSPVSGWIHHARKSATQLSASGLQVARM